MKTPLLLLIGTLVFSGCAPSTPESILTEPTEAHVPDPAIVAKLEEIIALREMGLKSHQLQYSGGVAAFDNAPALALAEAKIALARETNQLDVVLAELKELVKLQQNQLRMETALVEDGRRTETEIVSFRVKLLESEIALLRAQRAMASQ